MQTGLYSTCELRNKRHVTNIKITVCIISGVFLKTNVVLGGCTGQRYEVLQEGGGLKK